MLLLVALYSVVQLLLIPVFISLRKDWPIAGDEELLGFVFGLASVWAVGALAATVSGIRRSLPRSNFIRLEQEALTQVVLGRERRWLWSELSAFTLGGGSGPSNRRLFESVTATAPDDRRLPRVERWLCLLLHDKPRLRLWDRYEIPGRDLAVKLNACRNQALRVTGDGAGIG